MEYNFDECKHIGDYFAQLQKSIEKAKISIEDDFVKQLQAYLVSHSKFKVGDVLKCDVLGDSYRIIVERIDAEVYPENLIFHVKYYGPYANSKGEKVPMPKRLRNYFYNDELVIDECIAKKVNVRK